MQKIQAEWVKVDVLQAEKVRLAQRLEQIVSRARERGKAEWKKVGGIDLDELEKEGGGRHGFGEMGGGQVLLPSGGLGSGTDGRPYKSEPNKYFVKTSCILIAERKPNALPLPLPTPIPSPAIVHPPQPMAPPSLPSRHSHSGHHSSRHSAYARHGRHVSTSTLSEDPDADGDADGDGEADADGDMDMGDNGDGDADDTLYCFCQQKSYGEMIGCDNDKCEFEWVSLLYSFNLDSCSSQFHVKCVNISGELPETWYCPSCVAKLGFSSSDGSRPGRDKKGRKR